MYLKWLYECKAFRDRLSSIYCNNDYTAFHYLRSNYISIWGNLRANFQTASLPLLIVLIMTFLMAYINNFM